MTKSIRDRFPELEPYLDKQEPSSQVQGTTLAQGTDSRLVRTSDGDVVLTDKHGSRRK